MLRQCFRVAVDRHLLDVLDPLLRLPHLVHGMDFQFQLRERQFVAGNLFRLRRAVAMKDELQILGVLNLDVGQTSAGEDRQYQMDRSRLDAVLADVVFQMHYFLDALLADVVLADVVFQKDCFRDAEPVGAGWRKSMVAQAWEQKVQELLDELELLRLCVPVLVA